MNFSNIFSKLIEMSDIKGKELSERIGYDESYISKWATGKLLPSTRNYEELIHALADVFTEKIWYDRKEKELLKLIERKLPLQTEESVNYVIYRLLLNSFHTDKAIDGSAYPENTFIFMENNDTLDIILSIVNSFIPKQRASLTIYCSVNFAIILREFLLNINKTYVTGGMTYNIKVLIPPHNENVFESDDRFQFFTLLGKMTVYNIDFYKTDRNLYSDYIYIEVEGGQDGVILLNKTIENETFLMSYSRDSRVCTEYKWRNEYFFREEELMISSVDDKYFEYNSLIACLYPNNNISIFTTYFESMFISQSLFEKLIKKKNIQKDELAEMRKIRNLYETIAKNSNINIILPKDALIEKVTQRKVVVGKYSFELTDQEWSFYKRDLKAACNQNKNIKFGLMSENLLPIPTNEMSIIMIVTNHRAWIKKEPDYIDDFTKPFLNVIDRKVVEGLNYTFSTFGSSIFMEEVSPEQFFKYVSNIEAIR